MNHNISVVPGTLFGSPPGSYKLLRGFFRMAAAGRNQKANTGCNHFKNLCLVYFKLTPLCNLHCVMCGQRGIKGNLKGKFAADEAKTIVPLDVYRKLIDEIAERKPVIYIWGGEPFLYPDLMPLAKYMKDKGLFVSLNTNGTLLEKHAEQIVRDRWDAIFVSLDAFRDVNDAMRGEGSYDKVIKGFEAIEYEKKRQKSKSPFLCVVTVVTNRNYQYLDELAESLKRFNITVHMFNLGTYTNDNIVAQQRRLMKEKFNVEINCLESYNTGFNEGIDGQKLFGILQNIHNKNWGHPMITVPALNPEKINQYYGSLEVPIRNNCIVPWCQANINYNGDVHFCADYPDYILGSIKEQTFKEIFNGERANLFRREIHNSGGGMFPGCLRCYQNMLFGKKIKGY